MTRPLPLRDRVASKIGATLGPPGGSRWNASFKPAWPYAYSEAERRELVLLADQVIELVRGSDQ